MKTETIKTRNNAAKVIWCLFACIVLGIVSLAFAKEKTLYSNNREPLLKTKYVKLPLGSIKPQGWLLDQFRVQANGLTSHLPEVWDIAKTSSWKGDSGKNVLPECCTARYFPRWLEGLLPLAYMLDDQKLKDMVAKNMSYILSVENIATVTPSLVGWSHLGRVLPEYYEITKDKRTISLCKKILNYADSVKDVKNQAIMVPKRLGMLLSFSWWYYNQTGDKSIFESIERSAKPSADDWRDYFSNFKDRDITASSDFAATPNARGRHGVDVAQAMQYSVMYYLKSKDESYKNSVFQGIASLDKYNGQVGGRWNADEYLAGLSPTQGTELCDITELIYSLEKNFEALGDISFSDRLEQLMFNSFPGTCTGDMWSHQYDQQANQVLVSDDKRTWRGNTNTSNIFGFTPNFPCCLSNMHSAFPRYVEYMWLATGDNGLVAQTYGPNIVKAKVGNGMEVSINEVTNYPFSDKIQFTVNCSRSILFPIYFRIPTWSGNADLSVNGEQIILPEKGSLAKVERKWKNGDVVRLSFNSSVRTERRLNNSVSIAWGPLYFSLRIGESFKQISIRENWRVKTDYPTGAVNWQIDPTTPWNFGLAINPEKPEYELITNKISSYPFVRKNEPVWLPDAVDFVPWSEDVPVIIKMKARLVPQWGMVGASAGQVPLSPVKVDTKETIVELIPYGCTRLRISEFPLIQTVSN